VKTRIMALLAVVAAAGAACSPSPALPIRIDLPGVTVLPAGSFRQIVVANFRDEAPSPEFALGRELQEFLVKEMSRSFDGKVSRMTVPWENSISLDDPAFWRQAAAGRESAVVLTGTAGLVGQVRKALNKKALPIDGPFKITGRAFLEYKHYTLAVDVAVISAATGEPLFRKSFREEKDYIDLEKPHDFAFSELADRVRTRLFPVLLGTPTAEERTLLRR